MENKDEVIVLQFSGGKDSIACLLLHKEHLDKITVVWCDTGDAFPETYAQMEKVKAMCPNFVVAKGDQPLNIENAGYPVDVLPMRNHAFIQMITQQSRPKLQGFAECCNNNLWKPLDRVTKELGATKIIRGQKACDHHKNPLVNGDVVEGVTYIFPVEDWTDEEVLEFVKDSDLLPEHYAEANTSLDCMHCTAYLAENTWKSEYLSKNHPATGKEVHRRLILIATEIQRDIQFLPQVQS